MRKIPTALVRNPDDRAHVLDEVTPGCEWVFAGEGVATRKYDGTCTMVDAEGKWWARREVKPGKEMPPNYVVDDHDPITGKWQGWEPIKQSAFAKFHAEALEILTPSETPAGTYELVGPKINGNPEGCEQHCLVAHDRADVVFPDHGAPRTVVQVKAQVQQMGQLGYEGIVWHHPDGRMAKLKARDLAD